MASELSDIPHNMRRLYRRFERWRNAHTGRLPIPDCLWAAATELARQHGVFAAAKALRLEYGKLKQLAEATVSALKGGGEGADRCSTNSRRYALSNYGADPHPITASTAGVCGAARAAARQFPGMTRGVGRPTRPDEGRIQGHRHGGVDRTEPSVVGRRVPDRSGRGIIQITPQMRILGAAEAVDGGKGIDSPAQLCQEKLQTDPFSDSLLVFRSRRGTAIRILVYNGQECWLAQKRLSKGRFRWWPEGRSADEVARRLEAHQLQVLLAAGDPTATRAAPAWRPVSVVGREKASGDSRSNSLSARSREENDAEYRKYLFETQLGGPPGAAYVASVLIALQDRSMEMADFYQGTTRNWGGLFDEFGVPCKPYFTFKAFKFLLDTPERVATLGSDDKGFAVIAGLSKEKSEATVLISNFGTQHNRYDIAFHGLPWKETFTYEK
jgi:hypothetical protein